MTSHRPGPADNAPEDAARARARAAYEAAQAGYVDLLRTEFPHLYRDCLADAARVCGTPPPTPDAPLPGPEALDKAGASWVRLRATTYAAPRILRNQARCNGCLDTIASTHRHDYRTCTCGAVSVDGGLDYLRRGWTSGGPGYTELSRHETPDQVRARLAAVTLPVDDA